MKGAVFTGDRQIELMDFPDPTPGPGEVVLEIRASGMCGSRQMDTIASPSHSRCRMSSNVASQ